MDEDGGMELLRLPRRIEKQTDKDLYYLQSFSIYHRRTLPTLLTCPLHEKLIPQGDHLIKGCQYWKKDVKVFAPEAA